MVVCHIYELGWLSRDKTHQKFVQSVWVQGTNGLTQVPEAGRVRQVCDKKDK